jgi:predicted  nucleic acid-binding Zn-ribbon protein
VKAAVKSALSVVAGNPPSGGGIGGLEVVPTVPGLPGGSLETPVYSGDTVSTINVAAGNSAHNDLHLIEARLALLEDKMEGVEVVDAIERKKSGPTAASDSSSRDAKDAVIEALLQTVARLEARLEATEARLAQMETEQRSATDGRARDDVAMKEFIVHMEEAHVALAERLAHVESTVEQDSETSIGLLDMLIKKLDR